MVYVFTRWLHVNRWKVGGWVEINDLEINLCKLRDDNGHHLKALWRVKNDYIGRQAGLDTCWFLRIPNTPYFLRISDAWDGKGKNFKHWLPSWLHGDNRIGTLCYLWAFREPFPFLLWLSGNKYAKQDQNKEIRCMKMYAPYLNKWVTNQ